MPAIDTLIAFTLAAIIMNLSPGPSNLYVMARTLAQGASGGVVAAIGLAAGSLVHVAATVLGLAALFEYAPNLYLAVKLIGAAYLIYLAITTLRSSNQADQEDDVDRTRLPLSKIFWQSVVVEVTNPKTALFFLAFLPQFVSPSAGSVEAQLLILGIIVTLSALPCDFFVTYSTAKLSQKFTVSAKTQKIQDWVSATILGGLGAYILADTALGATE